MSGPLCEGFEVECSRPGKRHFVVGMASRWARGAPAYVGTEPDHRNLEYIHATRLPKLHPTKLDHAQFCHAGSFRRWFLKQQGLT